jgi:hypothetical protein
MMNKENPLKQYFRRPALYLTLPSKGVGYSADSIEFPENGELAVYPMTAIDEITSRTPDALYNGMAVTEIIKSCIPAIKKPWEILSTDMDPILVAIKIATNGQKMEIETTCPKCTESSKYDVNLTGLLASFRPGDYGTPLEIDNLKIKFKPLTYKEVNESSSKQFEIQRALNVLDSIEDLEARNAKTAEILQVINELAINILIEAIEYIKTPDSTVFEKEFISDYLMNCDRATHNRIKDAHIGLRKTAEIKPLEVKCIHCTHEYKQDFNINITDFFE